MTDKTPPPGKTWITIEVPATLIRSGTQLSSPIGSEDLRQGFRRVADAMEAMRSGAAT